MNIKYLHQQVLNYFLKKKKSLIIIILTILILLTYVYHIFGQTSGLNYTLSFLPTHYSLLENLMLEFMCLLLLIK